MRTIRNVFRRKTRAVLTISGIMIGVLALIVMGAMAEKITLLVDGGTQWYGDKVTVAAGNGGGMSMASEPLSVNKIKEIEKVDGVAKASANVMLLLDAKGSSVNMGVPPLITGGDNRGKGYETFKISFAEGRDLKAGETGKVTVGADLVKKLNAKVGQMLTIRGEKFEVVGIMEKTLTAPDSSVGMSLPDAQRLFVAQMPAMVRKNINESEVATGITVFIKKGYDPEKVAASINKQVSGLKATGPSAFKEQVASSTQIFTSIIFGIALISLIVGGLSVVNTMTMAVAERTREIGIRKAIGATNRGIIRQFIGEAAVISVTGGLVGVFFGSLFVIMANAGNTGTPLFLLTARLVGGSLAFALVLGILSGLYPAFHAARMNPVAALRHE